MSHEGRNLVTLTVQEAERLRATLVPHLLQQGEAGLTVDPSFFTVGQRVFSRISACAATDYGCCRFLILRTRTMIWGNACATMFG
jgi:hypothetical protein